MKRKVRVDAMEVLVDIQKGLNHPDLMAKYGLSPRGLASLLIKLKNALANFPKTNNRVSAYFRLVTNSAHKFVGSVETFDEDRICDVLPGARLERHSSDILDDLLDGMNNDELVEKHGFSKVKLRAIFDELTVAGCLQKHGGHYTIPNWQPLRVDFIWAKPMGNDRVLRHYIVAATTIYPVCDPNIKGELTEVEGDRIIIKGISSVINQAHTLVMQSENFLAGKPLVFDARCEWVRPDLWDEPCTAQFTIINMSDCVYEEFQEFLSSLTLTMLPFEEPERRLNIQV
ncbi:MAG: hypothetical protein HY912_22450 [Desulfomonile tiedjei]|uniref:Uncharacterized protein n=1 Tax=Desulfomonile tiedjei TaxID=2358 RepID=A0A9D6V7Z3_9BACT|nr:hypothetical protein [Desulfomonile tiedjei]